MEYPALSDFIPCIIDFIKRKVSFLIGKTASPKHKNCRLVFVSACHQTKCETHK